VPMYRTICETHHKSGIRRRLTEIRVRQAGLMDRGCHTDNCQANCEPYAWPAGRRPLFWKYCPSCRKAREEGRRPVPVQVQGPKKAAKKGTR
jgi:hypothetical protein